MFFSNKIVFASVALFSWSAVHTMEEKQLSKQPYLPNEIIGHSCNYAVNQQIRDFTSNYKTYTREKRIEKINEIKFILPFALRYSSMSIARQTLKHLLPIVIDLKPNDFKNAKNQYVKNYGIKAQDLEFDYSIGRWWQSLNDEEKDKTQKDGVILPSYVNSLSDFSKLEWPKLLRDITIKGGSFTKIEENTFATTSISIVNILSPKFTENKSEQIKILLTNSHDLIEKNISIQNICTPNLRCITIGKPTTISGEQFNTYVNNYEASDDKPTKCKVQFAEFKSNV